jgi:Protein of unknown function (DUF3052)
MTREGYSGTPLSQKLGIKEGHTVVVLGAPTGFVLPSLPTGVTVAKRLGAAIYDVVVVFVKKRDDLIEKIATCRPKMHQAGGLWIAWPKRTSGVPTDIVEDTIREVGLPTGLVDNKVCAIDATWSGLRLVIRKENRK